MVARGSKRSTEVHAADKLHRIVKPGLEDREVTRQLNTLRLWEQVNLKDCEAMSLYVQGEKRQKVGLFREAEFYFRAAIDKLCKAIYMIEYQGWEVEKWWSCSQ